MKRPRTENQPRFCFQNREEETSPLSPHRVLDIEPRTCKGVDVVVLYDKGNNLSHLRIRISVQLVERCWGENSYGETVRCSQPRSCQPCQGQAALSQKHPRPARPSQRATRAVPPLSLRPTHCCPRDRSTDDPTVINLIFSCGPTKCLWFQHLKWQHWNLLISMNYNPNLTGSVDPESH